MGAFEQNLALPAADYCVIQATPPTGPGNPDKSVRSSVCQCQGRPSPSDSFPIDPGELSEFPGGLLWIQPGLCWDPGWLLLSTAQPALFPCVLSSVDQLLVEISIPLPRCSRRGAGEGVRRESVEEWDASTNARGHPAQHRTCKL